MQGVPLVVLGKEELLECRIVRRLTRFTILVEATGGSIIAHLNNTGRLIGIIEPGTPCLLRRIHGAKLGYRLLGVYDDAGGVILLDTSMQEKGFLRAVELGLIPWLNGCTLLGRNRRVSGEVIDYVFKCRGETVYVELKSAVMRLNGYSGYPDAPTERGRRQIRLLGELATSGLRAIVVFASAVPRVKGFKLYCGADGEIGGVVEEARRRGVVFKSVSIYFDPSTSSVVLDNPDLPVDLSCTN